MICLKERSASICETSAIALLLSIWSWSNTIRIRAPYRSCAVWCSTCVSLGQCHRFPTKYFTCGNLGRVASAWCCTSNSHRGAWIKECIWGNFSTSKSHFGAAGSDVFQPADQYCPRSKMGTGTRNVWRVAVADGTVGVGICARDAGEPFEIYAGDRNAQALWRVWGGNHSWTAVPHGMPHDIRTFNVAWRSNAPFIVLSARYACLSRHLPCRSTHVQACNHVTLPILFRIYTNHHVFCRDWWGLKQ